MNESTVEELSVEDGHALFDTATRAVFGISREQFLEIYNSGNIPTGWDHERLARIEILLPFGR
jgi:hypothetical protein